MFQNLKKKLNSQMNYWREYSIYRTITGDCNNPFKPSWGKSVKPFLRLLPAQYQDGQSVPMGKLYKKINFEKFFMVKI